MAAVAWDNGGQIRVYYQDASNVIQECCWQDAGWKSGATLGPADPNSELSAVAWDDGGQVRVYYQAGGAIREHAWSGAGWYAGSLDIPVTGA